MNDEFDCYLEETSTGCYLESLLRAYKTVSKLSNESISTKLEEIINIELELALMGSRKALHECTKTDNVRVIK